ncbi:ankyrin [Rostrohypoxylon terebratum]|nr:ankyrin [Rostrohypoxylon terebratum]
MPTILSLPIEIISYVARELGVQDLSAFSKSCRALYNISTPHLYRLVKNDAGIMCWAIDEGRKDTVGHLLIAGANPNIAWVQSYTRATMLAALEAFQARTHPPHVASGSLNSARYVGPGMRPRARRISINSNFEMVFPSDDEEDEEYEEDDEDDEEDDEDDDDDDEYDFEPETRRRGYGTHGDLTKNYYWTPLHVAARWGNDDIVNLLIKYGADVNSLSRGFCACDIPNSSSRIYADEDYHEPIWTPLHTAICHGHESTARLLISRGASMNVSPRFLGSDPRHITALHTACYSDLISVARFIMDEGYQTDVDVQDHVGSTPMSYAYYAGNWRAIDFLVEQGASVNATLNSVTLLNHACRECRFAEALRFIDLGVEISTPTESLTQCCCRPIRSSTRPIYLRESLQEGMRADVVKALIKAGADIEATDARMMTPLMKAALISVDKVVKVLLDEGADIHAQDADGETALIKACSPSGILDTHPEGAMTRTVAELLDRMPPDADLLGALEEVCTSLGPNPDKVNVARMLFRRERSNSCGPLSNNNQGLFNAALLAGNTDLCDELLAHRSRELTPEEIGLIVDLILISDNSCALEYILKFPYAREVLMSPEKVLDVIKTEKLDCAISLIRAGAPINYRSTENESCLTEACNMFHQDIVETLLEMGADPNEVVGERSPLMDAVMNEDCVVVEVLLDHGGNMHNNPEGKKVDGRSFGPLDFAILCGFEDVVETMVRHETYLEATDEERAAHLETACGPGSVPYDDGAILELLLSRGTMDPNTLFTKKNTTPLHLSTALDRLRSVAILVQAGANIHYHLSPAEFPRPIPVRNPFEGTTPLEWAIKLAPLEFVEAMISDRNNRTCNKFTRDPEMVLRYNRAACRRHKPEVLLLLLDNGLNPFLFDGENNSVLNIFCQIIEDIWPFGDPNWPASKIADRSAQCLNIFLTRGVDQHRKNIHGVSALDNIRRMSTYDGPDEFRREVAKYWNEELIFLETSVRPKRPIPPGP